MLYQEKLNVAPAMKQCKKSKITAKSLLLPRINKEKLSKIIENNFEDFENALLGWGVSIKANDQTFNAKNHSQTVITMQTTCFKVDFNENFVTLTPLK
jgi:hypothetical protein